MRSVDSEKRLKEAVTQIDATLTNTRMKEYLRAGLPGQSSSDGRGGEPPIPLLGGIDRQLLRDRNLYESYLSELVTLAERVLRIQWAWTRPYEEDPEKLAEPAARPCSNLWCTHACTGKKDDVLRNGRCPACAQFFRRNGKERPFELCSAVPVVLQAGSVVAVGDGGK